MRSLCPILAMPTTGNGWCKAQQPGHQFEYIRVPHYRYYRTKLSDRVLCMLPEWGLGFCWWRGGPRRFQTMGSVCCQDKT